MRSAYTSCNETMPCLPLALSTLSPSHLEHVRVELEFFFEKDPSVIVSHIFLESFQLELFSAHSQLKLSFLQQPHSWLTVGLPIVVEQNSVIL